MINLRNVIYTIVGLFILTIFFGSFYTVDQTERGVLLRNGALVDTVEPGLSFKLPIIDTVKFISVQSNTTAYEGLDAYSKDQQPAKMTVSVSWHIDPASVETVYKKYKDVDSLILRVLSRQVPTQTENVFGQYNAVSVVQQRVSFVAALQKSIRESIGEVLIIDSVQVENIDFSNQYEAAIAARMNAEVAVKTKQQDLEKEKVEATIKVTQAQAEADSTLAKAKAQAAATKLQGDAEATAIRAKADALSSNSNLIELTKAERWDGQLPTTMLPNSSIPFIGK